MVQPPDQLTTASPFQVGTTSSSGLPVTLAVSSGPATISGNTVTLTGQPGAVTIAASQAGNSTYAAAPDQSVTFQVIQTAVALSFTTESLSASVNQGDMQVFWVAVSGTPPITYQWYLNGLAIANATLPSYSVTSASSLDAGTYTVTASNSAGTITSSPMTLTVNSSSSTIPPSAYTNFSTITGLAGGTIVLTANLGSGGSGTSSVQTEARSTLNVGSRQGAPRASVSSATYQWFLNGTAILGATGSTYVIMNAVPAIGDQYTCLVSNSAGSTLTSPQTVNIIDTPFPGRLINVSCRAQVGTGANVVIAGFVVGGAGTSGSEQVLVRGSGPALGLAPFNIPGVLSDPKLTLTNVSASPNTVVTTDTAWGGSPAIATAATSVGAFPWSASSADSAVYQSLPANNYTATISGASDDSGVALIEVYDATTLGTYKIASPRLINLSARVQVGTGANVIFAGFVIGGSTAKTVLIRASGPALGLAPFNLPGVLADPQLTLTNVGVSPNVILATNKGWGGTAQITAAAASVGAFPWSSSSVDSAILVTLPPGNYTAGVAGASADTGVALIEVYEVE